MKSDVTITEIAQESGVSIATVSRYLNGKVPVSPEKRERIEAVINKYHYTPNALARSLISKKTMTLGVVLPDITNPYFSQVFQEIQQCAAREGYSIYLCNTQFHYGVQKIDETEYFRMLLDRKTDGVLVMGGQLDLIQISEEYKSSLVRLAQSVPVVAAGPEIPGVDAVFLQLDLSGGIATAYNYLSSLGHQNIAILGGQPGVRITEERLNAYGLAVSSYGRSVDDALICLSDYYLQDGYQAADTLIKRNTPFTAVITMNDNTALGAMRAFRDHHLSVPEDISLISCDQFSMSQYTIPRITGFQSNQQLWGQMLVRSLIQAIAGHRESSRLSLPTNLVVRESCCPPKNIS